MSIAKLVEIVQMALSQLLLNKLRAGLTMLGIVIGVASVILLVSLGQGVQNFILDSLSQFGSQLIFVAGVADSGGPPSQDEEDFVNSSLTESDLAALRDPLRAPDLAKVAYILTIIDPVSRQAKEVQATVAGVSLNYIEIVQQEVANGRSFTQADLDNVEPVALIGTEIVATAFDGENPIGESLRVGDVNFRVVGVLEPSSASLGGLSGDDVIFLPVTTAQRRLSGGRTINGDYPITFIMAEATSEEVVDRAVEQVEEILMMEHGIAPDEIPDFQVIAQQSILDTVSAITNLLTTFLAAIAGISLVVGGIGIMNIMLVTVSERTREIGLRKAVGAQRADILFQFLIESVTLSVIGGLIGTLVAMVASWLATALIPDLTVEVGLSSVILAIIISVLTGAFFGAFPANRAAKMSPIDALRYE